MNEPVVSVVLPACNEAEIIEAAVLEVAEVLEDMGIGYEIIVVDSASSDDTRTRAEDLAHPRVRTLRVDRPGKGAAVGDGLRAARGKYIGFMDTDLEIAPTEVPLFVEALEAGADAAIATKVDRAEDRPLRRRLSTIVYNALVRTVLGTGHRDHQGGMKFFRAEAADVARAVECDGWFWDTEVLVALGRRGSQVAEVPVRAGTHRESGLSVVPVTLELLQGIGKLCATRIREALARPWGLVALLGCFGALLALLDPRLLLTESVPAGYDITGHVYPMWLATERLWEMGQLRGWSMGWFAGFPLFYFYFPVPALLTALLAPVLGFLPAMKVMSVLGVLCFPFATYWLAAELPLKRVARATATVASCGFLFTQFPNLGGNIASTLGGEFAYGISMTLSVAYLASVLRAMRKPLGLAATVLPTLLLTATALSHTITTIAVVLGVAPLLLDLRARRPILISWIVGFMLTGFWSVPFVLRTGYMWAPFPDPVAWTPHVLPLLVALVLPVGIAGAWALRKSRPAQVVGWTGAVCLAAAAFPQDAFYSLRFMPYWYLTVFLFAGAATGLVLERAVEKRSTAHGIGALLLMALTLAGTARWGVLDRWAEHEFGGLESAPSWPAVEGLIDTLRSLPPGRVYWEDDASLFSRLGSRNLLTLLPYWVPEHDLLGGLWVESSPTAGVARGLDARTGSGAEGAEADAMWAAALDEMGALGVGYFIAVRPSSVERLVAMPGVIPLATTGPFAVLGIPHQPLVQAPPGEPMARDVFVSDSGVRFRAMAVGRPHRVAVSYFPNWQVEGGTDLRADGTMMSVVPTEEDVVLRFGRTGTDVAGWLLTLLGVVVFLGLAGWSVLPRETDGVAAAPD